MTVLCTLEVIARFLPKSITSSIGLYLPEQTTPYMTLYGNTPSVLTLLIADPCEKARLAAAKFLETMWSQIPLKQYFRHVPSSPTAQAATSIASMPKRISLMLYQVHFTLVYCIQHERDNGSLIPIVKVNRELPIEYLVLYLTVEHCVDDHGDSAAVPVLECCEDIGEERAFSEPRRSSEGACLESVQRRLDFWYVSVLVDQKCEL